MTITNRTQAILAIAATVFAGCLAPPAPESTTTEPRDEMHTFRITTYFEPNLRDRAKGIVNSTADLATDLPLGTPASNFTLWLSLRPGPGYQNTTWDYQEGCRRFGRLANHLPYPVVDFDCSAMPNATEFVLPPAVPDGIDPRVANDVPFHLVAYRLPASGALTFRFPEPIVVDFRLSGAYPPELVQKMKDPEGCKTPAGGALIWAPVGNRSPAVPNRFSGVEEVTVHGAVLTGDANLEIHWWGNCPGGEIRATP